MHVRSLVAVVAVLLVTTMSGCSSGPGPAAELESLLETLGNPAVSSSRLGAEVYRVLDDASRSAIDARAKGLSERLGVKVDADEVLQVRGLLNGGRVSRVEVITQDETRATIEVSFAPILFVPAAAGEGSAAPDAAPSAASPTAPAPGQPQLALQPVRLEVSREAGRWRLSLRDLGRLVSSVPLDAPSTAGAQGVPSGLRSEAP